MWCRAGGMDPAAGREAGCSGGVVGFEVVGRHWFVGVCEKVKGQELSARHSRLGAREKIARLSLGGLICPTCCCVTRQPCRC